MGVERVEQKSILESVRSGLRKVFHRTEEPYRLKLSIEDLREAIGQPRSQDLDSTTTIPTAESLDSPSKL